MADKCLLFPGVAGILVQFLLFICCLGVLVFKKWREGSGRSWFEFGLDSSKQVFGAGWVHVLNLIAAVAFDVYVSGCHACEWYWVSILLDTTLGTLVEYGLLKLALAAAQRSCGPCASHLTTGDYHDPDGGAFLWARYLKQLALWLAVVTGMKILLLAFMYPCREPLTRVAAAFLIHFQKNMLVELLVVMVITPLLMNAFQLWMVDTFLKKKHACHDNSLITPEVEILHG